MSIFQRPLTAILAAIAAQNPGVNLVEAEYAYSNPTPNNDQTGATNTALTITPNDANSPYDGPATINYLRLDLATLTSLINLPLRMPSASTSLDVANWLNQYSGLNFDVNNDIVSSPVSAPGAGGAYTATLTAQANSLGWIGTVTLPIVPGNYDLATNVPNVQMPGILYPNRDSGKPFGELYSYWRDFSAQSSALTAVAVANPTPQATLDSVAAILTAVTGDTWVSNAQGRFSVQNAIVLYNGDTAGWAASNQSTYSSVLVVQLDATANLGYSGNLLLHYNTSVS